MNLILRRRVGMATWVAGALLATVWSGFRTFSSEIRGVGFAPPLLVSPMESGRLKAINVGLHQPVTAEMLVAEMDTAPLLEEQAVLQAQLLAVQHDMADATRSTSRQFAQGVETSLVTRARVMTALRTDEALAKTLRERAERERAVAVAGAGPAMVADDLERELAVVVARITAGRSELATAEQAARAAQQRNTEAPTANEWSVVTAGRLLEQVEGRIQRQRMQAGIPGQVSAIFLQPGDHVTAGVPVLEVSPLSTNAVVGYLAASHVSGVNSGDRASVVRSNGDVLKGHVETVGVRPQPLPALLWVDAKLTEWGVPVKIVLEGGEVGPDEPVTVRL